jgi:hypothetical protein
MRTPQALVLALATATLPAQVPDGHVVVAAIQDLSSAYPGPGGLYVAHPRTPGTFAPIGNLPPALTGANGARSVLILQDRTLLAGSRAPVGQPVEIHRLQLAGLNVTGSAAITLGTALAGGGGVAQMALRMPSRVLAVGNGVAGLPVFAPDLYLVEVDLTTGAVTTPLCWTYPAPLPMNLAVRGVAFDPVAQTIFFALHHNAGPNTPYSTEVWAFAPGGGCTPARVLTLQGQANGLAWSAAGHLYVALGVGNPQNATLHRHTPATNTTTPLITGWDFVSACAVERTTGEVQLCGNAVGGQASTGGLHFLGTGATNPVQLANLLSTGQPRGALVGVDAAPAPVTYGTTSGALPAYPWATTPHHGRLPLRGNAAFFADVAWPADSTPLAAVWILDASPLVPPIPFLGVDLHVLPVISGPMPLDPPNRRSVLALPIPAALAPGTTVYLQAFHFTGANNWHATQGLRLGIL